MGACALALHVLGSPSLAAAAPTVAILCYHEVTRAAPKRLETVTPEFLRNQIRASKRNGWTFLSLSELLASRGRMETLPPRVMVLVFDDGYRSFEELVLPILREENVKATVARGQRVRRAPAARSVAAARLERDPARRARRPGRDRLAHARPPSIRDVQCIPRHLAVGDHATLLCCARRVREPRRVPRAHPRRPGPLAGDPDPEARAPGSRAGVAVRRAQPARPRPRLPGRLLVHAGARLARGAPRGLRPALPAPDPGLAHDGLLVARRLDPRAARRLARRAHRPRSSLRRRSHHVPEPPRRHGRPRARSARPTPSSRAAPIRTATA